MFEVKFATENDVFIEGDGTEIARILRDIADKVEMGAIEVRGQSIQDYDGNTIGEWSHYES